MHLFFISHLGTSVYLLVHIVIQAPDHEATVHEIMHSQGQELQLMFTPNNRIEKKSSRWLCPWRDFGVFQTLLIRWDCQAASCESLGKDVRNTFTRPRAHGRWSRAKQNGLQAVRKWSVTLASTLYIHVNRKASHDAQHTNPSGRRVNTPVSTPVSQEQESEANSYRLTPTEPGRWTIRKTPGLMNLAWIHRTNTWTVHADGRKCNVFLILICNV